MNCINLNTPAEIIEAFRACNNPGEKIELFECLATRSDPPIDAFLQILEGVKLEEIVALTILAFGKITDGDIKARLKESSELLSVLSQQAQSGATDLIRWAAATTIETVGFDFITVSQHLSEEPRKIAEKIVQSKIRRFSDSNLVNSDDYYDEFVIFWIYGGLERLKSISSNCKYAEGSPIDRTCQVVMSFLGLRAIKNVNAALQRAESMGDKASAIDENEVFEGSAQNMAKQKLESKVNPDELNILIENQLHCLQSNNLSTRKSAAQIISQFGTTFIEQLKQSQPTLAIAVFIFSQDWYKLQWVTSGKKDSSGLQELIQCYEFDSLSYNQLDLIAQKFDFLANNLTRKKVKQDCREWWKQALNDLDKRQKLEQQNQQKLAERKQRFEERKQKSIALKNQIEAVFNQVRSFNTEWYNRFFANPSLASLPNLTFESNETDYHQLFSQYDRCLIDQLRKMDKEWNSYWRSQISPLETQRSSAKLEESKLSKDLQNLRYEQENSSVLKSFLKCIVWYCMFTPVVHLLLAAAGPGLIFGIFAFAWFIVSIMLTGYLFSTQTRLLEKTVINAHVKHEILDSEIRHLYEKQDEVSQLLRPLIK
ncbi:MAG: hypothetical protein EAZ39_24895 [Oscillatoriales cyanobacterium]|uniref:hypothetical protein n=1 Tax=Microcoleus sp. PH2017_05_CCC_O_A TaxID=2798816 RepID=UPI001DC1A916|nr:hypothetical protein [Microcoleus sp. PH2017_05_CCC_O_A]MCC3437905.1 hypothetical protein [Microcoleus sp. PH2017_05_CCC_O_A]TAG03457.1 MAG: hypothetical protein EAZ45_09760 [Oscillatoriales cyanobacterium]TAG14375.1 MAG: hypothetical protein EAZ39_24895 [Oscillatoriales cyanobacterium]